MELFCLGPVVVWGSLLIVMAIRLTIRWIIRTWKPADKTSSLPPGRGMNWYYAAVIACSVVVPIASMLYCEGKSRGNRPHGLFMLGLFGIGILLFAIGQARSYAYDRRNIGWMPLIFIVFPFAIALLFLMNFGGNFSV